MGTRVALNHRTVYRYSKDIRLEPQIIRLKPAAHARTKIVSYSLTIKPEPHFINWIQDPNGNFLARIVFPEKVGYFQVEADLIADLAVFNPFDFFLEPAFENWPFDPRYKPDEELLSYLATSEQGSRFAELENKVSRTPRRTIDFLVDLNRLVQQAVSYRIRMEQNVQSPEETLRIGSGSCRDSALLLVELLRHFGVPARFVSGYLIQLVPDKIPKTGLKGPEKDFCDLHAWAEAYIPGAGWIGLDPTSGLLAGEGHIPLAASAKPGNASPVEGMLEPCDVQFEFHMDVQRLTDNPRALKPFPRDGREALDHVGEAVDQRLEALGYQLTMGGEPTFVSDTQRSEPEWNGDALGPTKKGLSLELMYRLRERWARGAIIHSAQGKWYPGESLPRWALSCYWRADGVPLWNDPALLANEREDYGYTNEHARLFMAALVDELGVDPKFVIPAYEDPMYFMLKERDLPVNVTPGDSKLRDPEERARLARVFSAGLDQPCGFVLPIQRGSWKSGPWPVRSGRLVLIPGDSPVGLRLPLDSLPWANDEDKDAWYPQDPMENPDAVFPFTSKQKNSPTTRPVIPPRLNVNENVNQTIQEQPVPIDHPPLVPGESAAWVIRTALCVQVRDGKLHLFFPPVKKADDWFALASCAEKAAARCKTPLVLEGYTPPYDPLVQSFQITPDPGVIEVNLPPAKNWATWKTYLQDLYECADETGLSTEKYQRGGQVTASGGGCHWTLGGPKPLESPFLKRPDLLRSWITFTNHHPSLSYLFAGLFIGSSSQAPRSDESHIESLHDIELAFAELDHYDGTPPPWLTDRLFRNLLIDASGNTHRTEICIDKLYSPDSTSGRRGLVEFRSWEMAVHPDLALSQSLLLRSLTLHFLEKPFCAPLKPWGYQLRDQWMLPQHLLADLYDVLTVLNNEGLVFPLEPFAAHGDFRFPLLGAFSYDDMSFELRPALEPWPVIGEEPGPGGTVRYVDSSVERVEILARNWNPGRYMLACRGRQIPLRPFLLPTTNDHLLRLDPNNSVQPYAYGTTAVAGIRFKAWKLPSGLHPTMEADGTLVIDLIDLWNHRVVAGCTYHVAHPAGRNYEEAPVNSFEAEARRTACFKAEGHTPGTLDRLPRLADSIDFPHTLDLRE